jgi:hypothetical protein
VQHRGDADPGAEVLRVGGDSQHRLRCRLEQQVVDERLVLERDVGDLGRQREHDMEVADRQQVGLALGQPRPCGRALALRAVPVAAGVVGDPPLAAVLASLDVTAKGCGAAILDRRHDLELGEAQVTCMGGPESGSGSTEDVGDLDRGAHGSDVGRLEQAELVERARHGTHRPGRHLRVKGGVVELGMPE